MKAYKKKSEEKLLELIARLSLEQDQKIVEEVKRATLQLKKEISKKIITTTEAMFEKELSTKDHDRLGKDFLEDSFSETHIRDTLDEGKKPREIRPSTH